jgi:hypothetical protein
VDAVVPPPPVQFETHAKTVIGSLKSKSLIEPKKFFDLAFVLRLDDFGFDFLVCFFFGFLEPSALAIDASLSSLSKSGYQLVPRISLGEDFRFG